MELLDGRALAQKRRDILRITATELAEKSGRAPCLAVILVGDDPASAVYVRNKIKACAEVGIESQEYRLPSTASASQVKEAIHKLNQDPQVNGILLQLPLPQGLDAHSLAEEIDPLKDADGLHSANLGLLLQGQPRVAPCTPAGVVEILKAYGVSIEGAHAVVVGRSEIVGKPMGLLLLQENATVTYCHSKTTRLTDWTKSADIVVVAAGRPHLLGKDSFKEGAVVVDVGIHRSEAGGLCGDVNPEGLKGKIRALTPVPGGVGPMTISLLLENTLKLAQIQQKGN